MANILIVDDEEAVRDLIKEILSAQSHKFTLAPNGAKAMQVLRKKKIDLAVVDRNMPGMTGIELIQLIRNTPKTKKVKVIMCTAASITKEIDEAFVAGADDYVIKPINFAQMLAKVEKVLKLPLRDA